MTGVRIPSRLFLDASVWIAAAGSRTGASALTLALCRHGHVVVVSSRLVLLEAERNIRGKLGEDALLRFYQEIAAQSQIIHARDAHVLAAALKANAEVLLTLDRKHFLSPTVLRAGLPFQIMTPGDFLHRLVSS